MIKKVKTINEGCFQKGSIFFVLYVSVVRKRIFSVDNFIYLN